MASAHQGLLENRPHGPANRGCSPSFTEIYRGLTYRGQPVTLPDRPPWHVVSARELSIALGVTLQTLANWRIRGTGPKFEPVGKYVGNRTYYRLDTVAAWLSAIGVEEALPRWTFTRKGVGCFLGGPEPDYDETVTARMVSLIEKHYRPRRHWKISVKSLRQRPMTVG